MVDLTYREWLFNTATANKNKEKPQLAKDPANYKRSEKNISEFEQVPTTKKEQPELQRFALAPLRIEEKNVDTNKAKEQMDGKQEQKRKNIENKKKMLEKKLNTNTEEMNKIKYAEKNFTRIL